MNEQELLVQRFVDNDLTDEERLQFFTALDANPSLRRQLVNTQLLIAEAAKLPRLAPSARLVEQITGRLAQTKPSLLGSLWAWWTTPRMIQWNMAGVVVAAAAGLVFAWTVQLVLLRSQPVPQARQVQEEPTVLVRLVLLQPEAQSVAVAGDFNGWNPSRTPLQRSGTIWTVTLPLKPGRYQYMFVVDGKQWVTDPLAADENFDGFGAKNAVLDVESL
jgi:hypothetical protein